MLQSQRKSAILTAAKKAKLKSNPSRVRFAESVTVNGAPVITVSIIFILIFVGFGVFPDFLRLPILLFVDQVNSRYIPPAVSNAVWFAIKYVFRITFAFTCLG